MNLSRFAKQIEKVITDNSPVILTSIGVAGTVGTAILTGKASVKAVRVIENYEREIKEGQLHNLAPNFSNKEKFLVTWKFFIPPVALGACTIASIIFANRIGTRRAAAIAAAYTFTEQAFEQYRDKVVETIGEVKEKKVRDEIAQDRVNENPVSGNTVFVANGEVLCMEAYTGRYFKSDHESIRRAENDIKAQVLNDGYASLGDFYYHLGLPRTSSCEEVGWNTDKMPEIHISATVAEDGKPCLVISYYVEPIRQYMQFH